MKYIRIIANSLIIYNILFGCLKVHILFDSFQIRLLTV